VQKTPNQLAIREVARTRRGGEMADRTAAGGSAEQPQVDWDAAASSPEFRELVRAKKRFIIPATAFFMAW
jgi:hypothetical protein